jgi:hypothetical protein
LIVDFKKPEITTTHCHVQSLTSANVLVVDAKHAFLKPAWSLESGQLYWHLFTHFSLFIDNIAEQFMAINDSIHSKLHVNISRCAQ